MAGIGTSSRSDEYLISVMNEDDDEVTTTESKEALKKYQMQTAGSGTAISHASSTNSTEEIHWYRSMSGLAAEVPQGRKRGAAVGTDGEIQDNRADGNDTKWYEMIIQAAMKTEENGPHWLKFAKVPPMLRKHEAKKQNLYSPSYVCIGPYHYSKKTLRQWNLKARLAYSFVRAAPAAGSEDETARFDRLFKKVQEVAVSVKKHYCFTEKSTMTDKEFAKMMFLDACFVLQFISWSASDYPSLMSVMNDHIADLVSHDLLLLENQVPFQVLASLMGTEKKAWEFTIHRYFAVQVCKFSKPEFPLWEILRYLLWRFVCSAKKNVPVAARVPSTARFKNFHQWEPFADNPQHVLAFFHDQFINNQNIEGVERKRYSKYSAKELKKAGVHFRASKTPFFTDVRYKRTWLAGELTLPQITIDESTKSMLLNLVAYEYSHEPADRCWVTSYVCFMDSLINDAEDVKVLRSKGILFNFRETDEVVADLFNEMGTYLVPNPSAYVDAIKGIDEHYQSYLKKWIAEFWRIYFRSPWSILAVVAAALAIFLTAVQTYYAAFGKSD